MRAQSRYSGGLETVTHARHFTRDALARWGCEALAEEAQLVVSELVSNAVRHAGTDITLMLDLDDERLRIEVVDGVPELPEPVPVPAGSTSGRGFLIVNRLADAWGAAPRDGGKVVWCELTASR